MKKKIFAFAIIALSFIALPAAAQNKADNKGDFCKKECVRGDKAAKPGKDCKAACPFEGLNLTDAQKTKIQELQQARQQARKQKMEAAKEAKAQQKAAKAEQRKAAKQDYLNQVKAILTPEQYQQFLENSYINAQKCGKGSKGLKGVNGPKRIKAKDGKGQRPEGQRLERPAKDKK